MKELKEKFIKYLVRDNKEVVFTYNEKDYLIHITNAYVFPQAYPAVYDRYNEIASQSKAYIVDVGGYTTDVLLLRNGKLDLECCYSLESGVIKLFNRAVSVIASRFGGTVDDTDIRNVLNGKETLLGEDMRNAIMQVAESHTNALLESLQANDIDLSYTPSYFVGGGALLLRQLLEKSGRLKNATFITDTLANAKGYESMAKVL
jgi:plasmid segregation protein ParM